MLHLKVYKLIFIDKDLFRFEWYKWKIVNINTKIITRKFKSFSYGINKIKLFS